MESWTSLVRIASLGTARTSQQLCALDFADCPEGLREALLAEAGGVPAPRLAQRLLDQAAVLALARRAGYRATSVASPAMIAPSPGAATTADRPVCRPAAAARLVTILATRRRLLPEWLALLDAARGLIPPGLLPEMLELGAAQPPLQPLLRRLVGERGRWLAGLEQRWNWAAAISIPPEPLPPGERLPDPERLAEGRELVFALVSLRPQSLERTTIEIRQPTAAERERLARLGRPSAPEADGGQTEGPDGDIEASIHLETPLARLLAALDPAVWKEAWSHHLDGPEKIVRAAARSVEREMLLDALTAATARWKALEWVEPLIAERLSEPTEEGLDIFHLLPAARQEHWILQALRKSYNLEVDQPGFWLLTRSNCVWGPRIAAQLWPLMRREIEERQSTVTWDWRLLTTQAALRLDPQLAAEAEAFFAESITRSSPLVPDLVTFLEELSFRAAMAAELRGQSRSNPPATTSDRR